MGITAFADLTQSKSTMALFLLELSPRNTQNCDQESVIDKKKLY